MNIYDKFAVRNSEVEGVWIEYPSDDDGTPGPRFKCRSANTRANKPLKLAMDAAMRRYGKSARRGELGEEVATKLDIARFVDHILVTWDNLLTEDGDVLVFSKENAIALFEKLPKLFDDLSDRVCDDDLFDDGIEDDEVKN